MSTSHDQPCADAGVLMLQRERWIWKRRLNSILRYINQIVKMDERLLTIPRAGVITGALTHLQKAGEEIFHFFSYGYAGDQGYTLEEDSEYSFHYVFKRIVTQISHDLFVYQTALEQRHISSIMASKPPFRIGQKAIDTGQAAIIKTLAVADLLADDAKNIMSAYLPANEDTRVLSYLNKSPNVRTVPYAPIALIGIPFSSFSRFDPRDLLAIPHEFAHYLYWYGREPIANQNDSERRFLRNILEDKFEEWLAESNESNESNNIEQTWIVQCAEELFADVVSCFIGGPVVALSIQDLMLGKRYNEFYTSSGHYPTPALRPYIHIEVLKCLGQNALAVQLLEERWNKHLQCRKMSTAERFNISDNDQQLITTFTRKMVEWFTKELNYTHNPMRCWSNDQLPADDELLIDDEFLTDDELLIGDTPINKLYRAFKVKKVKPLLGHSELDAHLNAKWILPPKSIIEMAEDLQMPGLGELQDSSRELLEDLFANPPKYSDEKKEPQFHITNWAGLLEFGGWMTGGPEANNDQ